MSAMPKPLSRPSNIAETAEKPDPADSQNQMTGAEKKANPPTEPRTEEEIRKEQGGRLKNARERKFRSASDAARELKIPVPTYSAHESGLRGIKSAMADYYARMLDVTPAWLISGTGSIEDRNNADGLIQKSTILSNPLMADLYDLEDALNVTWDAHYAQYVRADDKKEIIDLPSFKGATNFLPLIQFSPEPEKFPFRPTFINHRALDQLEKRALYVAGIVAHRCVHTNETKQLFAFQHKQVAKYFSKANGEEFSVFELGRGALEAGEPQAALVASKAGVNILLVEEDFGATLTYYTQDGQPVPIDQSKSFTIIGIARSASFVRPNKSMLAEAPGMQAPAQSA